MADVIKNRYEFVILFDVENGNPNGDPDAGNLPRIDPESGYGIVTDVCIKRKIRNYVETVKEDSEGYKIYIKEDVPLNRSDSTAYDYLGTDDKGIKDLKKKDPEVDRKIRDFMCRNFFDILSSHFRALTFRIFFRSDCNSGNCHFLTHNRINTSGKSKLDWSPNLSTV